MPLFSIKNVLVLLVSRLSKSKVLYLKLTAESVRAKKVVKIHKSLAYVLLWYILEVHDCMKNVVS